MMAHPTEDSRDIQVFKSEIVGFKTCYDMERLMADGSMEIVPEGTTLPGATTVYFCQARNSNKRRR